MMGRDRVERGTFWPRILMDNGGFGYVAISRIDFFHGRNHSATWFSVSAEASDSHDIGRKIQPTSSFCLLLYLLAVTYVSTAKLLA